MLPADQAAAKPAKRKDNMTTKPTATETMTLADFPLQTFDKVRYADTDRQGHVNNAGFAG